jgi:hypothetical protein
MKNYIVTWVGTLQFDYVHWALGVYNAFKEAEFGWDQSLVRPYPFSANSRPTVNLELCP